MESQQEGNTTEENKSQFDIEIVWNDRFPPLNLWNWPSEQVIAVFYKDNNVWY